MKQSRQAKASNGLSTVSTKYRIAIPQQIRERFNLKAGQKLIFIPDGKFIRLEVAPSIEKLHDSLKGMDATNIREEVDEER